MTVRIDPDGSGPLPVLPSAGDLAVVGDRGSTLVATGPSEVLRANGEDALRLLDDLDGGWWAGFLSYDLGRAVEPFLSRGLPGADLPDLLLARFDRRRIVDAAGGPPAHPEPVGPWTSSIDRDGWHAAVARILEHLADGDCYQVNLTRQLEAAGQTDPVALFRAIAQRNPAPHAALVRIGDVCVVSASPELFLRRDGARIETRPIKGTSPDPGALARSEKDRAENVMIVDLARNDLGRLCEYGSIHVPSLFDVEAHPGLYHLVSTVTGTLRRGVGVGDVIRATFPPASVTGCPKPRVLQIIEDLEPVRRGVYCGAIGFIDADNDVIDLNVAIRTFTINGGRTYFGVGGGIVADSDAEDEWRETELKARKLLSLVSREQP